MSVMGYNGVTIFESLNDGHTGNELRDELDLMKIVAQNNQKSLNFRLEKIDISSSVDLYQELDVIASRAINSGSKPILHFEIHGLDDKQGKGIGLKLKNGESVLWENLSSHLRKINIAFENNLIIGMGVCYGLHLREIFSISEPAPFWGLIGTEKTIANIDVPKIFAKIYMDLVRNFDIQETLAELNLNYGYNMELWSSEQIFMRVIEHHLKNCLDVNNPETIELIDDITNEVVISQKCFSSFIEVKQYAKKYVVSDKVNEKIFNDCSEIFFMKGMGNNRERFSAYTYDWLKKRLGLV